VKKLGILRELNKGKATERGVKAAGAAGGRTGDH
jgi:hypothetical protein